MFLRRFILFISLFSLVVGIIIGVSKSGFWSILNYVSPYHFLILCGSFFGTLITLERVVTIKNNLIHFLPVVNGSSILFFLADSPLIANGLLIAGGLILLGMYSYFFFQHKDKIHFIFILSALCYTLALIFYYFNESVLSIQFFELFFLMTIAAERLELSNFLNISENKKDILTILLILSCLGVINDVMYGFVLIFISIWFILYDIARINIRSKEPHKFRGYALIFAYYWLFLHGLSFIFSKWLSYDTRIHSFFLGFVVNMVFAHISIILPAVLKVQFTIPSRMYYFLWILFQLVLLIRFISSDKATFFFPHSTFLSAIIVLIFFATNVIHAFFRGKKF